MTHYDVVHDATLPTLTLGVSGEHSATVEVDFAIDTGFTEVMTLPPDIIDELNLQFNKEISLTLADGAAYSGVAYRGRSYQRGCRPAGWNETARRFQLEH